MTYQILARKYRPSRFDEVLGQEGPVRTLQNAVREERVAPAYIFSGTRGVGKTTIARLLAKALNCEKGPTPEPCGECVPCREIAEGRCLDVIEIDAASNTGVDNVRELRESIQYTPARDRFKVFIIDEAHMLSNAAWNALLKTLEEPPPHARFVFATTEPDRILDTIKSRSQHFDFRSLPREAIRGHLEKVAAAEGLEPAAGVIDLVARAASGSVRDGLSILDQVVAFAGPGATEAEARAVLGLVAAETLDRFLGAVADRDAAAALDCVAELATAGQDLRAFCGELIEQVRMIILWHALGDPKSALELADDEVARLQALAERFRLDEGVRLFGFLEGLERDLRYTARERHLIEVAAVRMTRLVGLVPMEELVGRLLEEGGAADEPGPAGAGDTSPRATGRAPSGGGSRARRSGAAHDEAPVTPAATGGEPTPRRPALPRAARSAASEERGESPRRGASRGAEPARDPGHDPTASAGPPDAGDEPPPIGEPPPRATAGDAAASGEDTALAASLVASVRRRKEILGAYLGHARSIVRKDDALEMTFAPGGEMWAGRLKTRGADVILREAIQETLGEELRPVVVMGEREPRSGAADRERPADRRRRMLDKALEDPVVRHTMDRFRARVVEARPRDPEDA